MLKFYWISKCTDTGTFEPRRSRDSVCGTGGIEFNLKVSQGTVKNIVKALICSWGHRHKIEVVNVRVR